MYSMFDNDGEFEEKMNELYGVEEVVKNCKVCGKEMKLLVVIGDKSDDECLGCLEWYNDLCIGSMYWGGLV